jgi:apolipoprotein N-acyltransferase
MQRRKKLYRDTGLMLIVLLLLAGTGPIEKLPWWSFVIPVMLLGIYVGIRGWDIPCFCIGFVAGFIVWAGAGWWLDLAFSGRILNRMGIPVYLLILTLSGLLGGLLTGLAMHTGKSVFFNNRERMEL